MAGSPKEKLGLQEEAEETSDTREIYLRDGKKLVVSEAGADQLVEIRDGAGLVEVRIRLTEQGPVLQLDGVRLQLKASESVEIESPRVAINGSEAVEIAGGEIKINGEEDVEVEAEGDVRVRGKIIHLN